MTAKKYILVLSGGGAKGAFQVGALNYLNDNGIKHKDNTLSPFYFHYVAGVSVGSLNGTLIAMNKPDELNRLWEKVKDHPEEIYTSKYLDHKNEPDFNKIREIAFSKKRLKKGEV